MSYHVHRFTIGDLNAVIVADDFEILTIERLQNIFPSMSDELHRTLSERPALRGFSRNILYLEGNDRRVLIDTGMGALNPQGTANALPALRDAGVDFNAVQTVIITHLHGDHFGGLVDADKQPNFPNATIYMSPEEWNFWMHNPNAPADRTAVIRPIMEPLQPKIQFCDFNTYVTPEIYVMPMVGHTAGQIGLLVQSAGQQLLHIIDVLHSELQMQHPDIAPKFDTYPDAAVSTRQRVLAHAADLHLLTLAYHLPFPGLGYVERQGNAFTWKPNG